MKLNYRPDIDGLRAIAIISVIIYHAKISINQTIIFKGGYLGVDIFFVISGYLISYILFEELKSNNKLCFKSFYQRRIRRIIPALIGVLLFSSIFAVFFLMPKDLIEYSKSSLASLSFVSNFLFYFSEISYGAEDGLLKPLLHTWSLSVEEQFYLIFPLVIFIIFIYFKKYLLFFLVIIFCFSLIISTIGSVYFDSLNFYSIHSRIWEMLLGSFAAYIKIFCKDISFKNSTYFTFSGLLLIIFSLFYFNENTKHPSYITLIPTLATFLVIFFGNSKDIVSRLLSFRYLVFIGLISYSLYLWHYPIFAFSRILEFTKGDFERKIIIAVLVFIASLLSYYLIEKPFRNKKQRFSKLLKISLSVILLIALINITSISKKGFAEYTPEIIKQNLKTNPTYNLLKDNNGQICDDKIDGCYFSLNSQNTIYAIGDSHLATIAYDLKEKILSQKYNLKVFTLGGCGYFPGFDLVYRKTKKIHDLCNEDYFSKLRKELLSIKKTTIIFHARWPMYFDNYYLNSNFFINKESKPIGKKSISFYKSKNNNLNFKNSFKKSIIELINYGHKIIVVLPVPEVGYNIPRKLFTILPKFKSELENQNFLKLNRIKIPYKVYSYRSKSSLSFFSSINSKNLILIYPDRYLCNLEKTECYTHDEKNIFYDDNNHLSFLGSKMINEEIIKYIK